MNIRILKVAIVTELDVVDARKRALRLARLLGFDNQDQVRIATAVSEIARNAFEYGRGGQAEFRIVGARQPQSLEVTVTDKGPGIADLDDILAGARISPTGMGLGLTGSQRLMDEFAIETKPGAGTTVRLSKRLPARAPLVTAEVVKRVTDTLAADAPADAMDEIRAQNRLILSQLDELRDRHEELRLLNQELQDTNRGVVALYAELDERADHLRRADELKSKFLSHMSHEFRTPLNSILALSSLLLRRTDGDLGEEQEKQVRFIRGAAENLTELVDDLLDLAKVEAGKIVISPSNFTVESMFGALRGMLRPLLPGNDVALIFDDASLVPELCSDEAKVSQILRNFISNALKFTERGEVRVSAVSDPLTDRVTFTVSDTGIGISRENIDLIFQEFAQVPNSLQNKVKGTGLGLPLAKKLAELLGGAISVDSAPGQGSTFSVTIPRAFERAEESPWEEVDWTFEEGKVPILVVEDNPVDVLLLRRMLAGSRYQMLHAGSTAAARAGLERLRPAAILLDIVLPERESWGLMLELRRSDKYADIPLLVVSATGEARKALHFGADEYLEKPVRKDVLLSLLDRLTGRSVVDVLMIDDEEVSRYLVRQLLPRSHYALREARDAHEGLRQMRMTAPDVVLLDLNMPGMSGYELLARIRADEAFDDVPAIVVTSAVLEPEVRRRLSGAAAILAKSELSADLLADAIDGVRGKTGEDRRVVP